MLSCSAIPNAVIIESIEKTGQRAIIQHKITSLKNHNKKDNILFVEYIPHSFLFKYGKCIIHHGGAGSTYAACKAGVPSIIIPHLSDQPYWGQLLYKLGVSPKPIHKKKLTVITLTNRIINVINSSSMRKEALNLSKKIKEEKGLDYAVELISNILS